jgi:hypothetical protein
MTAAVIVPRTSSSLMPCRMKGHRYPRTSSADEASMSTKTELTGLGLRFSDTDTEREFLKFFDSQFIVQFRAAMILGIVLIFIDALVDNFVAPVEALPGNAIRLFFVEPILLVLLAGSFTSFLRVHFQTYVCVVFSVASIGLLYGVELIAATHAPIITTWVGIINYFFVARPRARL